MSNNDDRDVEIRVCPFCNQEIAQRPQQQPPFAPPFGPPSGPFGPQFMPPPGPPSQQQPGRNDQGPPMGPPPSFVPQQQIQRGGPGTRAIDPGAIRPCTNRFVYIWPQNGNGFWAWLVFVGRRSAAGWRWSGRRWVYFGIDLNRIEGFVCQ